MPYNPAIPLATDLISDSQPDLYGNFQAIDIGTTGGAGNVGFSREHVTMTDASNGGLHVQATMKDQAAVTPPIGYGSYYASKTGTKAGTITEAVYKSGDATPISLLSAVKAWGRFTGSGTTIDEGFNFNALTKIGGNTGQYNIKLTNALTNSAYAVLISTVGGVTGPNMTSGTINSYAIIDNQNFQIYTKSLSSAATIDSIVSFVVLQS